MLDERAAWGRQLSEASRAYHERAAVAPASVTTVAPVAPLPGAEPDEIEYMRPDQATPGQYAHPLALGGRRRSAGEVRHELGRRWAYEAAAPGWRRLD